MTQVARMLMSFSTIREIPMSNLSYYKTIKIKIADRFLRSLTWHIDQFRVRQNAEKLIFGLGTKLYPTARIDNTVERRHRISVGSDTHIRSNLEVFANGGTITIGDHCYLGDNTRIWSMESIRVGHRVLISHGVNIHDHNAHSLSAADRHRHLTTIIATGHPVDLANVRTAPAVIDDDAWVGFNATILKGVHVGRGAIVGACAVVTADVPAYSIVVGNPARIVGESLP